MEAIEKYLEYMIELTKDSKQSNYYKFLLEKGKSYGKDNKLEKQEFDELKTAWDFKIKNCFNNSLIVFNTSNQSYKYIEGYYLHDFLKDLPIEHAFNLLNDEVKDFTHNPWVGGVGSKNTVIEYWGVEIPNNIVEDYLFNYQDRFESTLKYYYWLLNEYGK